MNYYNHHIGDYLRDTSHLSLVEHGAYLRMLHIYYATEKPLPRQQDKIHRLIGAKSHAEKLAIDVVLGEFWTESEDGWSNARADAEIAKSQEKSDAARKSAVKRWQSEGNANAMRTHSDGNAKAMLPITNNQEPIAIKPLASSAKAPSAGSPLNGNAVAYIPLNDGTEFGVSAEQFSEFERLYPAVDIKQTLNEIRGWNMSNPSRKKTRRGVLSHINSWLSKEQNRGPQGR